MNKRSILNLFFYLMSIVAISCLTSCSDNDGDGPKDIDSERLEGTWDFEFGKMRIAGQTVTIDKDDLGGLASEMGVSGFMTRPCDSAGCVVMGRATRLTETNSTGTHGVPQTQK